jgi:tol-pal system protein YbgF
VAGEDLLVEAIPVPEVLGDGRGRMAEGSWRNTGMASRPIELILVCMALVFSVTACASQKDVVYLHNQLNTLNRQTKKDLKGFQETLGRLEEHLKATEAKQKEIERDIGNALKGDQESLRGNLAQLQADLLEMRDSIQTLTGRVEETSHVLQRTIEQDTTEQDALVSQVKGLSSAVEDLAARLESIEKSRGSGTARSKEEPQPEKGSTKGETRQTESALYERTLEHYWDGRYDEAIAGFNQFLALYPKSDLADNANFWIGECYRATEKYEEAILAYQKVINDYPNGNKVPSAMLHQALAFEKINDSTTATLVYKKLLKKYPKTREAEIARKRLKQG